MKSIEIKRQIFHAGVGLVFVALIGLGIIEKIGSQYPINSIHFLPPLARPLFLLLIACGAVILLTKKHRMSGIEWLLENFERPRPRRVFPGKGVFFYIVGAFLISVFLETETVAASMAILSIGDSVSHIVGKKFGKIKHPLSNNTKNIEGHLIGGLLAGVAASLFVNPLIGFIAAFGSMFVEGIYFGETLDPILEDNLILPIISGIIIVLMRTILI